MWQLFDALIEGVDAVRRVDYACCGAWRAWVESDGRAGLASLLLPGHLPAAAKGELTQYRGMKLRDLASLAKSDDPPWLMKGNVRPVSGMNRVTPPTMMKAWSTMMEVRPTATNEL